MNNRLSSALDCWASQSWPLCLDELPNEDDLAIGCPWGRPWNVVQTGGTGGIIAGGCPARVTYGATLSGGKCNEPADWVGGAVDGEEVVEGILCSTGVRRGPPGEEPS